jgi:hypothetical protein
MRISRLLLMMAGAWACSPPNFAPPSLVQSVRILATAADKPYAIPGDAVSMQVLAYDGRPSKPEPMQLWWMPQPCIDPGGDNYYACYAAFAQTFRPGVDLASQLTAGTSFSFQMPGDVITSHQGGRSGLSYGMAVLFTIACAGHVEYVRPPSGAPPDTLPFGCFTATGGPVGTDGFVFAYSTVYSFTDRTNANPVIQSVTFAGATVDPMAGVSVARCTQTNIDDCPTSALAAVVPASSDEVDPGDLDANGNLLKEEIYVDYYLTAGKVRHDTIILFDPRAGQLSNTSDSFYSTQAAGDALLWAVVHDNRGGVSWAQVPVHVN